MILSVGVVRRLAGMAARGVEVRGVGAVRISATVDEEAVRDDANEFVVVVRPGLRLQVVVVALRTRVGAALVERDDGAGERHVRPLLVVIDHRATDGDANRTEACGGRARRSGGACWDGQGVGAVEVVDIPGRHVRKGRGRGRGEQRVVDRCRAGRDRAPHRVGGRASRGVRPVRRRVVGVAVALDHHIFAVERDRDVVGVELSVGCREHAVRDAVAGIACRGREQENNDWQEEGVPEGRGSRVRHGGGGMGCRQQDPVQMFRRFIDGRGTIPCLDHGMLREKRIASPGSAAQVWKRGVPVDTLPSRSSLPGAPAAAPRPQRPVPLARAPPRRADEPVPPPLAEADPQPGPPVVARPARPHAAHGPARLDRPCRADEGDLRDGARSRHRGGHLRRDAVPGDA